VRYWLVNSGTTQDPWVSRPIRRYREWHATEGEVHGFSRRPVSINVGDVLIHRAVGSPRDRIVAVAEVVGPPVDRGGRWPWRLPRRLTYVCSTIEAAPTAADLRIAARGLRTFKELDPVVGRRAVERIREAGEPFRRPAANADCAPLADPPYGGGSRSRQ
jgi:hypothetical protein